MPSITLATQTVATQTGTAVPTIPTTVLTNSVTALDTTAANGATSNADNTALPLFGCRAFVNFNGSSYQTVGAEQQCAIRASGNISKVVRGTNGVYTIHFATPMPDNYYSVSLAFIPDHNLDNSVSATNRTGLLKSMATTHCIAHFGYMGSSVAGHIDYATITMSFFR